MDGAEGLETGEQVGFGDVGGETGDVETETFHLQGGEGRRKRVEEILMKNKEN